MIFEDSLAQATRHTEMRCGRSRDNCGCPKMHEARARCGIIRGVHAEEVGNFIQTEIEVK